MLKRSARRRDRYDALLRTWESVRGAHRTRDAAAKTAAALARVHDVPLDVLAALDSLLSFEFEGQGRAIYVVVSYLRALQRLNRSGISQAD